MSSVLRNYRKIYTTPGADPSMPGRVYNLETNEYKVTYYQVVTGTSGTLTVPSGGTINSNEFGLSGNAILSKVDVNGKPTFESPVTSGGSQVTASLNVLTGAWVASGVYTSSSVALIYSIKIKGIDYHNLVYNNIIETVKVTADVSTINLQSVTDGGSNTTHVIETTGYVKTGGTSSQFLKADGSVDSTTYLSTQVVPAGGTTGQILAKVDDTSYNLEWIENYANYTSVLKHTVKAGEAINKGQAVYVSSADGTNMIVSKASNTSEATSSKTMGLLAQTLATNGKGFVITEGLLDNVNTFGATAGDPVWLGTSGNLIFGLIGKPYAPAHLVFIGIVTRVSATVGEIFVKVQNGFELKEIHDVDLITTTPINGHILGFNGSLWVNKTIAGWLGYTPYDASNPSGFITSSALAPYLTINDAALTYFPIPTGTTSQYLRGDGTLATFPTIPTITPSALTKTDDTNVTLTLGGSPSTALLAATSITVGWTGTLADGRIASAATWNAKQDALSGTGFVKSTGGVISYDTNTYLTTSSAASTYVPYTGATGNVDLGTYTLTTPTLYGSSVSAGNLLILSTSNATTGTITIGNRNNEFVYLGNQQFGFTSVVFYTASSATGFSLSRVTATDTTPTFVINRSDGTTGIGGALNKIALIANGLTRFSVNGVTTSGATNSFTLTKPDNTNQTLSTSIAGWNYNGGSRQWATGNITTQSENVWGATTYSFVGASTITNAYGNVFNAPIAGTNATITNNYAALFNGNVQIGSSNALVDIRQTATASNITQTASVSSSLYTVSGGLQVRMQSFAGGQNWLFATGGRFLYGTSDAQPMEFYTNTTKRFEISAAGILNFYGATNYDNAVNITFGTTTGSKIGTVTNQKLSFWAATPIVQPANTVSLNAVLENTGLMASGSTISTINKPLVVGANTTPRTGVATDGVTSVLGNLQNFTTNYHSGEVLYSEVSGEALNFGQLCYRNAAGKWQKATGSSSAIAAYNMLGICLQTVAGIDTAISILTRGYVETTYLSAGAVGNPLFMDATTAGSITNTAPSTAGNIVRIIGNVFWSSATQTNSKWIVYFNPDNTWIEL